MRCMMQWVRQQGFEPLGTGSNPSVYYYDLILIIGFLLCVKFLIPETIRNTKEFSNGIFQHYKTKHFLRKIVTPGLRILFDTRNFQKLRKDTCTKNLFETKKFLTSFCDTPSKVLQRSSTRQMGRRRNVHEHQTLPEIQKRAS